MGEMIKYGVKLLISASIFATVLIAITVLVNTITSVVLGGVLAEVLGLIGMFLPWNGLVMSTLNLTFSSILAFLFAIKIFNFMSDLQKQT